MRRRIILLLIVAAGLAACKEDPRKTAKKIVKEWVGKTIQLPEDIPCVSIEVGVPCPTPSADYRVLLYTDSVGCISCKLQLVEWQRIMEEADSLFPGQVDFLFYFQPKREKELLYELRQDKFDYPVFIDKENKINRLNHFPSKMEYQCYLLDKDNKVLIVGNPTLNSRVWELYKKKINGD